MPKDGWYLTLQWLIGPPIPHLNIHPADGCARACRYFLLQVRKQGVREVLFCLVYPMAGSPFWASCSFRHRQHRAPFRPPSRRVPETSLAKESTHHHAICSSLNRGCVSLAAHKPTASDGYHLVLPPTRKKTCEFHSFVRHTVTPNCCVSPDVPKSGGGEFVPPL